jgi:hypothetical protein
MAAESCWIAADQISHSYSALRAWKDGDEDMYRVMPITARTLETLYRLSTSHAKARLSYPALSLFLFGDSFSKAITFYTTECSFRIRDKNSRAFSRQEESLCA